jgi:hypothetical protein
MEMPCQHDPLDIFRQSFSHSARLATIHSPMNTITDLMRNGHEADLEVKPQKMGKMAL